MKVLMGVCLVAAAFIYIGRSFNATAAESGSRKFTAYGIVRSLKIVPCDGPGSSAVTVVRIAGDDGKSFALSIGGVEPRLWQGLHVRIAYRIFPRKKICGTRVPASIMFVEPLPDSAP